MWQRRAWTGIGVLWLASFAMPAMGRDAADADPVRGWTCMLLAWWLLLVWPPGGASPEFDPGVALMGAGVLANLWFIWAWHVGFTAGRELPPPGGAVRVCGLVATGLVIHPLGWVRDDMLLAGYYCWAGATAAACLLLWLHGLRPSRTLEPPSGASEAPDRSRVGPARS